MQRAIFLMVLAASCGGSQHTQVPEVPIEQGGGHTSDLPPDEVGDAGGTTSSLVLPDASAPPGVGPQSLDVTADAGTTPTPVGFVQRTGGLSEKECTDVVLAFAKLTAREKHATAPAAADLGKDPIYGPMVLECGNSTTKKQQKCTATARTSAAWKKCME
jgi:hypothetical protein